MKTRFFVSFVSLLFSVALLSCMTVFAEIYSGSCDKNLSENVVWELNTDTGVLTISGEGEMADYTSSSIPWYSYKEYVKTVYRGDAVTNIGRSAFSNCTNLTEITIGKSVQRLGLTVFNRCPSLSKIAVADGNAYFCVDAMGVLFNKDKSIIFKYPNAIENTLYIVPDGVTRIEECAFNCSKLVSIDLPDSLKVISGNAFGECTRLTSIEIPNSVATMLSYAFSGCDKATSEKLLSENDWSIRKAAESVKGALQ